jgi:hypothetical protein
MDKIIIKAIDPESGILEGLGIPYGGSLTNEEGKPCDLEGEYFSPDTDFRSKIYDGKSIIGKFPVLYHHGMDKDIGSSVIGRVLSITDTPKGKWFRMQLDKAHEYYRYLLSLAEMGALTLSSGADGNEGVQKAKDGKILKWPLREISITPSAMNPDAQLAIKSLEKLLMEESEKQMSKQHRRFRRICKPKKDEIKEIPDEITVEDENAVSAITKPQDEPVTLPEIETKHECETEKPEEHETEDDRKEDKEEIKASDNSDLIRNLATISDALQSVISSLGAVNIEPADEIKNTEEGIDEKGNSPDLEEDKKFEQLLSDNSREISAIKDEIADIKRTIGYDSKAREGIAGLERSTSESFKAIRSELEAVIKRISILESQPFQHPVTRAENPRIVMESDNQKAYERIMASETLSVPTKSEMARQFAADDINDILHSYKPVY